MTVYRQHRHTRYTVVPNEALERDDLSWKAKGLLSYLLSRPDNWEARVGQLVTASSDGRRAVLAARKELVDAGYLVEQRCRDVAGQLRTVTHVFDTSGHTASELPCRDATDSDDTGSTFPHPGGTGGASTGSTFPHPGAEAAKPQVTPEYRLPDAGKPDAGKPDAGKPDAGKRHPLTTKERTTTEEQKDSGVLASAFDAARRQDGPRHRPSLRSEPPPRRDWPDHVKGYAQAYIEALPDRDKAKISALPRLERLWMEWDVLTATELAIDEHGEDELWDVLAVDEDTDRWVFNDFRWDALGDVDDIGRVLGWRIRNPDKATWAA